MPRRCWLHTRAALLGHQIQNFYSSWALLNEFFTEWAVFQQLSHHQACSEQKKNTFKVLQNLCWIQSWLYSSEFKGVLRVVLNLTLILAGPSPKAAFPCFIDGFTEAFAPCVTGTLINNTQTLKGSEGEFFLPTSPEKGHRNSCNSLGCRCPKPGLTWFLFQQGAGPLPLLGLSHLLLQEVRCE